MYFNECNAHLGQEMLDTQVMWMGSAMSIDKPKSPGRTLGSAQDISSQSPDVAGDEAPRLTVFKAFQAQISMANVDISGSQAVGHLSLKKEKLVRGLQKAINKYLHRHCEEGHPTTDLLRQRIYAALEGALLGIEVDDIMSKHHSQGAENLKTNDRQDCCTDDNVISPVAQHIWNTMKCGLFALETVPSVKLEPLLICERVSTLAGMPGGYPTE
ncbi:uncharacterized protein HD556DRAFT_1314040 [Suillus plorans]|uniref:Uncharacterized protein n=1 Tax=Suillus plorans TaxID=116603 RepID=A0A9P7DB40_9AGAM|nr:uncharacterized protein HD556DRAFT_1314040 [Suillus plorans]KAG1785672.1 hypothetical protein HD556DRAFT_1314040 [Suillus plorans]